MTNTTKTVTFLIIGILGFVSLWFTLNPAFQKKSIPEMQAATLLNNTTALSPFSLIDTAQQTFTSQHLKGHWNLMFFGYTHCPDICPATLSIVKDVWSQFDKPPARFLFASINPTQDSNTELKQFLTLFHDDFIGLTGDEAEMKNLMSQLNIFSRKQIDQNKIDHTAALILINPKGQLKAVFTPPLDPVAIANDLKILTNS